MNILFRVDCNKEIGSGHFSRCYTLSQTLKKNHKVFFLSTNFDKRYFGQKRILNLINIKESQKISEFRDIKITSNIIKKEKIDTVILDNYTLKKKWCNSIKKKINNFIIIDDNLKKNYNCDLYLDYSNIKFVKKKTNKLLGLRYFLLNKEYIKLKNKFFFKSYDIFINFGTGNFINEVKNLLKILNQIDFVKKVILVGRYEELLKYKKKNYRFKITSINKFKQLGKYIKKSKICIGGGGVNALERTVINNKNMIFSCAKNQISMCRLLSEKKNIKYLGKISNLNKKKFRNKIQKEIINTFKKKDTKFFTLVDGKGASRVAREIEQLKQINEKI